GRRAWQVNASGVATIAGGRRGTWAEFRERVARFAGALQTAGVQRGDRVAILALNGDVYLEYFCATPWAGALVVPLNIRLAAPELIAILNDAGASALVVDEAFAGMLPALQPKVPWVRRVFAAGGGAVPGG